MDEYEQLGALLARANRDFQDGRCKHLTAGELSALTAMLSSVISPEMPLSKEQASLYFHLSTRQFDRYVALGKIPQGKKIKGFTERVWYRSELSRITL